MEVNLGTRPSTQQSWGRDTIRVAIAAIQRDNPRASDKQLIKLLAEQMRDDDDVLRAAADWCVKAALASQNGYSKTTAPVRQVITREERQKREEEITVAAKKAAEQILILNWEMPNGKRLRFCTGNYVASVCASMAKAGKKAGRKNMGEVFSEQELRAYLP